MKRAVCIMFGYRVYTACKLFFVKAVIYNDKKKVRRAREVSCKVTSKRIDKPS